MRREILIDAADGVAKAMLVRPDNAAVPDGQLRGVILYMDAMGPRESLYGMAQRLADAGHVVLVPDLFYRFGAYGPFTGTSFGDDTARAQIMKMLQGTSQEMTKRDTAAFLAVFDKEKVAGPIGTVGYCMGGARALTAAAAYPDRIAAAASFHGGNLASEAEDSPHRLADRIKARIYVGVAGVDNSFPPEQSARLAEALRTGGVDHIIENYVGMAHGWAVPDHSVYNETGAERHWTRLLTLFDEALA
ncbi:carboxymethylenebutenolidase [Inquilinus ginsengisoli]|uniref:Carboxymethylenebutenolidase n=1 Tax=Inquilinus ginsengisoli TaxID=363840 RepID=A0ABU1JPL8_9PROT|nr:dienelactone hydrolase family protein [Inquilinus ginsengisoli]MDR6290273.1 carboxymethylenebutenolidase [Inquilinus ginsengisoli]